MLDPNNPVIHTLAEQGYRLAGHAYLHAGQVKYTYVATAPDGQLVQGWSRGGDATDALMDLARRAGLIGKDAAAQP